jgi:hypothetical protein
LKLYSLDAVAPGSAGLDSGQVVPIRRIVGPKPGPTIFVEREVAGVSSLLEPIPHLIKRYGLEWMYGERKRHSGEAVDLPGLMAEYKLTHWDVIRTDLEGADFSVICSLGSSLADTSVVEMELRTEPFYFNEPYMHEVVKYMADMGFEVLDLKPERWRAKTKSMRYETRGRLTFCNTVFVNRRIEAMGPVRVLRHALAVGTYGYPNFAERVWEPLSASHPEHVAELEALFFGKASVPYQPFPSMDHVTHSAAD